MVDISERDERMLALFSEGQAISQIADAIGVKDQAVKRRINLIKGVGSLPGSTRWGTAEEAAAGELKLIDMIRDGKPMVEICKELGRSRRAVVYRMSLLRSEGLLALGECVTRKKRKGPTSIFNDDQDEFILAERSGPNPTPFKTIAAALGLDAKQVASRAMYLRARERADDPSRTKVDKSPDYMPKSEPLTAERIGRARSMQANGFSPDAISNCLGFSKFQRAVVFHEELPRGPHRDLTIANAAHLIDIKRAGYSPRCTEYDIPPGDNVRPFRPDNSWRSYGSSPAGQCALEVGYQP